MTIPLACALFGLSPDYLRKLALKIGDGAFTWAEIDGNRGIARGINLAAIIAYVANSSVTSSYLKEKLARAMLRIMELRYDFRALEAQLKASILAKQD